MNEGFFSDAEKTACITPAEDRLDWMNYRPVSVLNVFSQVLECFILDDTSKAYFLSSVRLIESNIVVNMFS